MRDAHERGIVERPPGMGRLFDSIPDVIETVAGQPISFTVQVSDTDPNATVSVNPINLPDGTGPNKGRFGTLGRNTFRGPAFYNYDFAFIKNTPLGKRKSGIELVSVQFRAEFFNIFNIVTMGLPANTLEGAGFGLISKTAGNSRQIQFSLKVIY